MKDLFQGFVPPSICFARFDRFLGLLLPLEFVYQDLNHLDSYIRIFAVISINLYINKSPKARPEARLFFKRSH